MLILTILSTVLAIGLTIFTAYLKRKEYKASVEKIIEISKNLTVFTSRDSMLKHLHSMYDKAVSGDIVWGQSVTGGIYGDISGKIVTAAARGVKYEMIFNSDVVKKKHTDLKHELESILKTVNSTVKLRDDNDVRIQGLSDKEVVIALPTTNAYSAVLIKDSAVVRALHFWFNTRYNSC